MKLSLYLLTISLVMSNAAHAGGFLDKAFKLDRSTPTESVPGKEITEVSGRFIEIMMEHGFSVDKQANNVLEFSKQDRGLASWAAKSSGLRQSESINCGITKKELNVIVSCRTYNVATDRNGKVTRDDQTHSKKYRKRLIAKLAELKNSLG